MSTEEPPAISTKMAVPMETIKDYQTLEVLEEPALENNQFLLTRSHTSTEVLAVEESVEALEWAELEVLEVVVLAAIHIRTHSSQTIKRTVKELKAVLAHLEAV
jgi:hypothetical protein